MTTWSFSMSSSDSTSPLSKVAKDHVVAVTVFAREAGVAFQPPLGSASGTDPFAEWLSLMEVVQMLCPAWPVRDAPMQGKDWRI